MKYFALFALATLVACGAPGSIPVESIQGTVADVTRTHDAYVEADETLSEEARQIYLTNSELLRLAVDEAQQEIR